MVQKRQTKRTAKKVKLTYAVLSPEQLGQIISALCRGDSQAKQLAAEIERLWRSDEIIEAYQKLARAGLSDEDFDVDQFPTVSQDCDEPGAYVQVWKWIPAHELPEQLWKKIGFDLEDREAPGTGESNRTDWFYIDRRPE
jgi:hypothetical protein